MSKRKRDFDHHDNNSIRVKQELSTPTKTRPDLIPLTTLLVMIDNVIDKMEKKAQLSAAATNHEEPSTGGDAGKANDNNGLTEPSKQNGTTNNVTKQHIETGRNSTKTNGTLPGDPVSQTSSDPAIPRPRVVVEQPILKSERVSPIPQEPEITSSQPELNGHDNNAQVRTEPYTPNLHSPKIDTSPPPPPQQQQQQQQDVLADGKAKVKTEPFSVGSQGQNGTPLVKLEPREVKQEIKLEVKQETMYSATNGHGSTNGTDIEMPPVEQSNDLMKPNYNQDPTAVVEEPPSVEQAVTKLLQDHILNKFD